MKLLKSENTTLAIPYNPLYKVVGASEKYSKFLMNAKNVVRPVEKFNLQELSVAQIFYHIGYIKTDPLIEKNMGCTEYWGAINMCKIDKGKWDEINDNFSKVYPPGLGVYAVWLTGDLETDTNTINIVENVNGLIFYYYNIEGEYPRILKSGFEYWLNNPVNTPVEEVNINSDIDLFEEICNNVYLIGDFPKEVADKICSGTYNTGIVEIEGIHFFD